MAIVVTALAACASTPVATTTSSVSAAGSASTVDESPSPFPSIHYDGTKTGFFTAWARCLQDSGWDARFVHDGGVYKITSGAPVAQNDAYIAASDACIDGLGRPWDQPLSEVRAHELYEADLARRDCLIAAGFSVPVPPTFATYYDELKDPSRTPSWSPFDEMSDAQVNSTYVACPESDTF